MELFEAIAARYSYRDAFTADPVPRRDLTKIVQAGLQAPSGKNLQTTQFVIVDDAETLAKIKAIMGLNEALKTAPAMVACLVDREPEPVFAGLAFQTEDCSAAVENMLLAIAGLGYASVWVDGGLKLEGRAEQVAAVLGVPDSKLVKILLPIGKPVAPGPRREKLPFEKRAWFNRYEG